MGITTAYVKDMFESAIISRTIIPDDLEDIWLKRAVARYAFEIYPITYDESEGTITVSTFDALTDDDVKNTLYEITADTLALYMQLFWKERDKARINNRSQIVTKDLSLNGGGAIYSAVKSDYEQIQADIADHIQKLKTPAYSSTEEED